MLTRGSPIALVRYSSAESPTAQLLAVADEGEEMKKIPGLPTVSAWHPDDAVLAVLLLATLCQRRGPLLMPGQRRPRTPPTEMEEHYPESAGRLLVRGWRLFLI